MMAATIFGLLGNLIKGIAGALPYALAYFAGSGRAKSNRIKQTKERRDAQITVGPVGDGAVGDGLRRGQF